MSTTEAINEILKLSNPSSQIESSSPQNMQQQSDTIDIDMTTLASRYPESHWILFSEDLSVDFVKGLISTNAQFSVVLKDAPLNEIREAIKYAINGHRYISQHVTELLFATPNEEGRDQLPLTATEIEILKDIALGLTTKEIAEKRVSSFHTINTHRLVPMDNGQHVWVLFCR